MEFHDSWLRCVRCFKRMVVDPPTGAAGEHGWKHECLNCPHIHYSGPPPDSWLRAA